LTEDLLAELDEEGFLKDPNRWSEEVATYIAEEQFNIKLTAKHWEVIKFFREYFQRWGTLPMIRTVRKSLGITVEELEEMFRRKGSSARGVICKISGLPKLLCISAGC